MPSRRPVVALAMALLFLAPSRSAMAQGAKGLEQAEPPDPEDDAPAVAEAPSKPGEARFGEEIVVTGSRIRRKDLTTPAPVTVLSREQLMASGKVTIGDFLVPVSLGERISTRARYAILVLGGTALMIIGALAIFASGAGWGLSGPLDGRGVFGAIRIFLDRWNYNGGLYHWLEVALSGVRTPGAVPVEPATQGPIRMAKAISVALQLAAALIAGGLAWRLDAPQLSSSNRRILSLLRLAMIPLGTYVLFTPTVHPWYVAILVPLLPFFWPAEGESPAVVRMAWPWLYLSCAVGVSYVTYLELDNFHELYWVRLVEYLPCYALLAWAGISQTLNRNKSIKETEKLD